MQRWFEIYEAAQANLCSPWILDPQPRGRWYWIYHGCAYSGIKDSVKEYKRVELLKRMSGGMTTPVPVED